MTKSVFIVVKVDLLFIYAGSYIQWHPESS